MKKILGLVVVFSWLSAFGIGHQDSLILVIENDKKEQVVHEGERVKVYTVGGRSFEGNLQILDQNNFVLEGDTIALNSIKTIITYREKKLSGVTWFSLLMIYGLAGYTQLFNIQEPEPSGWINFSKETIFWTRVVLLILFLPLFFAASAFLDLMTRVFRKEKKKTVYRGIFYDVPFWRFRIRSSPQK